MFVLAQTAGGRDLPARPRGAWTTAAPNGWTHRPPQGQARQPLQPDRRGRASTTSLAHARRRAGPRRPRDHGDDRRHPAGLRARLHGGDAHRAPIEAIHWATHRAAFGRRLADQPADDRRARRPRAGDRGGDLVARCGSRGPPRTPPRGDAQRASRSGASPAPVLKFWVCKRAPLHAGEALECQGGYGYVEESRLPRTYREAPLMSIWEGSGNVQALDVLRAMQREPDSVDAFFDELDTAHGRQPPARRRRRRSCATWSPRGVDEARARELTAAWPAACRHRCWSATRRPPCRRRLLRRAPGGRGRRCLGVPAARASTPQAIVARHRVGRPHDAASSPSSPRSRIGDVDGEPAPLRRPRPRTPPASTPRTRSSCPRR